MAHSVEDKEITTAKQFRKHFEDFVNMTEEERERAERRRDYRDLKQWTQQEIARLNARSQAPVVFDQFSQKVDSIVGLEVSRRTDPKAYPIHPKHQKASEVITDGLRFVESKSAFDETASEVFEDAIVEGYGGAIVEVEQKGDEFRIEVNRIPWDRIYYDAHSTAKDFSDSTYFGITLWMDLNDAITMWPNKKKELKAHVDENSFEDETFEDKPRDWADSERKRIRINQEYYREKGIWKEVFYSGNLIVQPPKDSPYLDEDGNPMCPIELESHFVDRDNNRWGYMQRLMDVQDEINHRRSKALHMLSSVSVIAERGQIKNREALLNELRKGMSIIEFEPIGNAPPPQIDRQQELGQSQLAFYQDAKQAMDSVGVNPELMGRTESAISGRAFLARQQSGLSELSRVFARHSEWKRRVYTQIWWRMKQFWTEEKWIRVSDEEQALRFVGINVPIRRVEKELERQSGMTIDKLMDIDREQVEAFIQQEIQANPMMGEVVETRNNVKELNIDIMIEEAPDTVTLQQEQFEVLANLAGTRADPLMFEALIMASSLKNKEEILEKFKGDDQQAQAQAQAQAQQIEMADRMAEIQEKQTKAAKNQADTQKTLSEIPLNEAKAKDELASAIERVGKASMIGLQ